MQHLPMQTRDITTENIAKLKALFPNAVTEIKDEDGNVREAIDFDVLRQELSHEIVEGREERYQFTWPDKKKAMLEANTPINKTLRPVVEDSVGKDGTPGGFDSENLYIEGDNLDVLKLLRETYLGKIKMIYIDPPYNTGNDFIYDDDFSMDRDEFSEVSGQVSEEGFRMVQNTESNGRFHTDWLNMMYPRLKLAKDLLSEDGVIFISIDDNEVDNLRKICDEIYSEKNFVAIFPWRKRTAKSDVPHGVSQDYEYIILYAFGKAKFAIEKETRNYYETPDFPKNPWRIHDLTKQCTASERPKSFFTITNPKTGIEYPANPNRVWRITCDTFNEYMNKNRIIFPGDYNFLKIKQPVLRYWKSDDMIKSGEDFGAVSISTQLPNEVGLTGDGTKDVKSIFDSIIFSFPKPVSLLKYIISLYRKNDYIILDFFSGSATTAHAVMQLNAEDGGHRKYIMVQLPELTDEKSEAYEAGYENICEIGKERIWRAGRKIKQDSPLTTQDLDIGFRCLRIDSSNMKDIYYRPKDYTKDLLDVMEGNIKSDRSPMDLLFQVMLDLGISLSSPIEETTIQGKHVFNVDNNILIACFDDNIDESVITEIAKQKPYYFVMRDSGMASDSVAANFEQIFETYSRDTVRRVL